MQTGDDIARGMLLAVKCRPPLASKLARFEKSRAFPYGCDCGYHFRTLSLLNSHRKAWGRVPLPEGLAPS